MEYQLKTTASGDRLLVLNNSTRIPLPAGIIFVSTYKKMCEKFHVKSQYEDLDFILVRVDFELVSGYFNLYAFTQEGSKLWGISQSTFNLKYGFTGIPEFNADGGITLTSIQGKQYNIDPKTGSIIKNRYNNLDFTYEKNFLEIHGRKIKFEDNITDCVSYHGEILVVLTALDEKIPEENYSNHSKLTAFNNQGNIIWTFICPQSTYGNFESIRIYNNKLQVFPNIDILEINPKTGEVENRISSWK